MEAAEKFSTELGTAVACRAFGVPRASLYRRRQRGADPAPPRPRAPSHRALGEAERGQVLDLLHSERFGKCANLSWKLKRLQTLWFDGIGRNNIKPVRERSRDEESVTFGEKTQEEASTG